MSTTGRKDGLLNLQILLYTPEYTPEKITSVCDLKKSCLRDQKGSQNKENNDEKSTIVRKEKIYGRVVHERKPSGLAKRNY